jgi:hypothetical protein
VVEAPEGVAVADQRALHERVLFERLTERFRSGRPESRRQVIPEPVARAAGLPGG